MKLIHKVMLEVGVEAYDLPRGAKVLHVNHQLGPLPTLWYLFDVENLHDLQRRFFRVFGTGHEFGDGDALSHVGSAICGPYVWHVFEVVQYK